MEQQPSPNPNPYAPPQGPDEPWMPAGPEAAQNPTARSSAPKVFGVLSIVFASLILLVGLMQSCGGLASKSITTIGASASHMEKDSAKAQRMRTAMSTLGKVYNGIGLQGLILTIMSAFLLAIGIGQVRYKRWAGAWSVYWSLAAFVALIAMVVVSFVVIGPAYEEFFAEMAKASPTGKNPMADAPLGSIFGGTTGVMMVIFYAPYPIIMLAYFLKPRVREAMVN